MARTKGTLKLSSNIEPEMSAPLDARDVVATLADLTASGSFPYAYVGMRVSVQATGDEYILTANDTTVSANWKKIGGEENTIESISLNGTTVQPDANKNVALTVITKAVDDLVNYYTKTDTYTKTEVNAAIGAISTISFDVEQTLPTENIQTNVIYLIPSASATQSNVYDEYINLDGTSAGWEVIGSTSVDLTGYVTTTALNTALADYTTTTDLTTLLAGKQDVSDVMTAEDLAEILQVLPINPASTYVPNTGFTPVGTVISVMGNHAPANYLACDGSEYAIALYPVLAKYFKDEFGSENYFGGDGTTTFAVPDLQGEFLRGTGTNSHTNQGNGANVGVHQDATSIPDFKYVVGSNRMTHFVRSTTTDESTRTQNFDYLDTESGSITGLNTTTSSVSSSNDRIYGTVRPTNTSVLYCIATKNIYIDAKCNYSTDETVVGQWIDGKPIYQKTIELSSAITASSNTWADTGITGASLNIDKFVGQNAVAIDNTASSGSYISFPVYVAIVSNNIKLLQTRTEQHQIKIFTLQYTKTTD